VLAVSTALLVGCVAQPGRMATAPSVDSSATTWQLAGRARTVETPHAMVASVHPIASEIGAAIMRQGGNAVDAAVAVGFALAVVHPAAGNLGGGGFMLVHLADGTALALDFRERAPELASREMYLDSTGLPTRASITGHRASGVPGSVHGLVTAHERLGALPLAKVMAPAIRLAREGFALDASRARSLQRAASYLAPFPASRRQFLTAEGSGLPEGLLLVQSDLARTLSAIAEHGAAGFYEGWVAESIVAEMTRGGGLITHRDLASYNAVWREPVIFTYRSRTVLTMPPPSSGITLAQILSMLELADTISPFGSSASVHLWAEVLRRAFADRNQLMGDPVFTTIPVDALLSRDYAATRFSEISPDRATPSAAASPGPGEREETTHYSVVDEDGNAVAVTTTINGGYGSGVTVSGAGFLLNNEMDDFTVRPGVPNIYGLVQGEANAIAPGKRMLSSMVPTILLDERGEAVLILGSPGGPTIISTVAQVLSNVLDHGMTLADAIAAPRVHHQALPDTLFYERGGLAPGVVTQLRAMGHIPVERSGYSGEVAAVGRVLGGWIGVIDPRSGGGAVGY